MCATGRPDVIGRYATGLPAVPQDTAFRNLLDRPEIERAWRDSNRYCDRHNRFRTGHYRPHIRFAPAVDTAQRGSVDTPRHVVQCGWCQNATHPTTHLRRFSPFSTHRMNSVSRWTVVRGISFRVSFLFPASSRHLGPFYRNRIMLLDHVPITENLPCPSLVVRTQFPKLALAFVPIERSVLFLIVKYSPKLETGVGKWLMEYRFLGPALSHRRIAHGYPHQTSPRPNPVSRVDRSSPSSIRRLPVRPLRVDHHRHLSGPILRIDVHGSD